MKAIDMIPNIAYKALTPCSDGTIQKGQVMWLSKNMILNLPDKFGGGFLMEPEWRSKNTSDFEVAEAEGYSVEIYPGEERLIKK